MESSGIQSMIKFATGNGKQQLWTPSVWESIPVVI